MSGENANDAILRQEWKKPTSTSNSVHDFYLVEYVGGLKELSNKSLVDFVRLPKRESKKSLDEVAKTVWQAKMRPSVLRLNQCWGSG